MTKHAIPYLQCYGLPRLVLHCTASLTPESNDGKWPELEDVWVRCADESAGRSQQPPTQAQLDKALKASTEAGWLQTTKHKVRVTTVGWKALGWSRDGRSQAPTANEALNEEEAVSIVLGMLVDIHNGTQNDLGRYWFDPRVHHLGEITYRELGNWASFLGASQEGTFERAIAVLLCHACAVLTPVGPGDEDDLIVVAGDAVAARADRGQDYLREIMCAHKTLTEEAHRDDSYLRDFVLQIVTSTETELSERINRLPARAQRDFANLAILHSGAWPSVGCPLEKIEAWARRVFRWGLLGNVDPQTLDWFSPPLDTGLVRHIQRRYPKLKGEEFDKLIYKLFPKPWQTEYGCYRRGMEQLFEEGKLRIADVLGLSADGACPGNPILVIRALGRPDSADERVITTDRQAPDEHALLLVLDKADTTLTQEKLADHLKRDTKTIRKALIRLEKNGLVGYPHGKKKGVALTERGKMALQATVLPDAAT